MTETIKFFTSLGNQGRLSIVQKLEREGPMCAQDLLQDFDGSQPHLSRQLSILKEGNVVQVEKAGTRRIYSLSPGLSDLLLCAEKIAQAGQ